MIRTQILLEPQLKKELGAYSSLYDKSLSQIVREALSKYFLEINKKQIGFGALKRLGQMEIKEGSRDLSERVDDVLYQL